MEYTKETAKVGTAVSKKDPEWMVSIQLVGIRLTDFDWLSNVDALKKLGVLSGYAVLANHGGVGIGRNGTSWNTNGNKSIEYYHGLTLFGQLSPDKDSPLAVVNNRGNGTVPTFTITCHCSHSSLVYCIY